MLGGPFKYLEHGCKVHRKFSRGSWKKVSLQKWGFGQNIRSHFSALIFQNPNFFYFSCHRIWLGCRTFIIFLLTQRASLSGPLKYIKYGRMAHRKFFRGSRRKSLIPKLRSRPACLNLIFNLDFSKSELFLLFLP